MKRLEKVKVTGLKYTGQGGNPLEGLRFEVATDKGAFEIKTDKVELLAKYGFVLVNIKAPDGDTLGCDNAVLVATLAKVVEQFENEDIWLGHNQQVALLTEDEAQAYLAKAGIPRETDLDEGVYTIAGKAVA